MVKRVPIYHKLRLLLQQPGWYTPQELYWRCVCCAIIIFLISSLIGPICKNSFDEVWQNTSTRDGRSLHSLVGIPIMGLHYSSMTFVNFFGYLPPGDLLLHFLALFLLMLLRPLWVFLCRALVVPCIVSFFSTIIASDVVKASLGFLIIIIFFPFIIPSFPILSKHKFIADSLGLGLPIRIIVRWVI